MLAYVLLFSIKMIGQPRHEIKFENGNKLVFNYEVESAVHRGANKFELKSDYKGEPLLVRFFNVKLDDDPIRNIKSDWEIRIFSDAQPTILNEGESISITKSFNKDTILEIEFNLNETEAESKLTINLIVPKIPPTQKVSSPTPGTGEDEKAWNAAKQQDSQEAYCNFANEYPQSIHAKESRKQCTAFLPMEVNATEIRRGSEYQYVIKNLTSMPELDIGAGLSIKDRKYNQQRFEFSFSAVIKANDSLELKICDSAKPSRKEKSCISFLIGNILDADWDINPSKDSIRLRISGGIAPYSLRLMRNGIEEYYKQGIPGNYAISIAHLEDTLPVAGEYIVQIVDGTNFTSKEIPGKPISIEKPLVPLWVKNSLLYFLIIIVPVYGLWFVYRYRKIQREKRNREIAQSNFEQISIYTPPEIEKPSENERASARGAYITPKAGKREEPCDSFKAKRGQFPYLTLSMEAIWRETVVEAIFISQEAVFSLHKFVEEKNFDLIPSLGSNIPEIGGMLMGNYCDKRSDDGEQMTYLVSIEKFVPIEAKKQNMYQLEFNTGALVTSVLEVQEEYPDLLVVGWFHTHPGHGVFLSDTDIRSQGQFRKPYQLAMVMDTCSENIDTGFFTWKPNLEINNKIDMKEGATWFSWTEIEKLKRRKK